MASASGDAAQSGVLANPVLSVTNEALGGYSERYFNLSQPVDGLWRRGSTRARAEASSEAAHASFRADSAHAVLELRRLYVEAWYADRAVASLAEAADLVAQVVEDAQIRYAEGDVAGYDLRRLEVAAMALRRRSERAELERADTELRLGALVSSDGSPVRPVPEGPGSPPTPVSTQAAADRALRHRPALVAARAWYDAARASTSLARAGWLTGAAVTGGYKRQSDGRDGIFLGLQIPVPVFDRRGGAADAARAREAGAGAEVERLQLAVVREARIAARRFAAARNRRETIERDGLADAGDLIESARIAYAEAEVGVVEVVDAAEAFVEVRLLIADARREEWIAWYELERAMGGSHADGASGEGR